MKIYSYMQKGFELQPIEVEVSLHPGLPGIQILGLPDSLIKESEPRLRAALKSQGFELPAAQKITINLRPHYIKKHSRGIDLALACAVIWKTQQLEIPPEFLKLREIYIYGELTLEGKVYGVNDAEMAIEIPATSVFLTGKNSPHPYRGHYVIEELKDLCGPQFTPAKDKKRKLKKPPLVKELRWTKEQSDLLTLLAAGEHSVLLAGPAGSGKTTLAECYYSLLKAPDEKELQVSQRILKWMRNETLYWRPFVSPHHSTTPLAMLGGGQKVFPGEVSRAHHGLLLLDEYLEFNPKVQEGLREPVEKGEIHITRMGQAHKFPAQFVLVATTNLCPCGDLIPGRIQNCQRSLIRCRSYLEKLSGPMVDRFEVIRLVTYEGSEEREHLQSVEQIDARVRRAQNFAWQSRKATLVNGRQSIEALTQSCDPFVREVLIPQLRGSKRRARALLRVARTLADMEEKEKITPQHFERAKEFTILPFEKLKQVFA